MTKKQFIAKLKRARRAVKAETTHCQQVPYCHHCALHDVGVYSSGASPGYRLEGYRRRKVDRWSFNKTKEEVLALFDNSIAALEAEVQ